MKKKLFSHNLKYSGPGTKMTLAISLAIIASIAMYNWSLSPQTDYLQAAEQYTKVAEDTERRYTILEKNIQYKQKKLSAAVAERDMITSELFGDKQADEFFSGIEPLATRFGCSIESLTYSPGHLVDDSDNTADVNIKERSADITLTGQYGGITQFIAKLSEHPQKVITSDLEMKITSDFSALNCNMTVTIYILENKEIDSDVE